jgi:CRP-like cAMP-binding protein
MDNRILRNTVLFRDMSEDEICTCLKELKGNEKTYKKGTVILHAGEETDRMGLVLEGSVTIESNDV